MSENNSSNIVLDSGFYFGKGVFETIFIKNEPVFLQEHVNRLNDGLKTIGIDRTIQYEYVKNKINDLRRKNCAVKIAVSEENMIFSCRDIIYTDKHYEDGFKLTLSNVRRNSTSLLTYVKSLNYLENILERDKCKQEGYDEVLFLNEKGFLCEGSISNVFFVKDNKIFTPNVNNGLLDGIMRTWVINNFKVYEGDFIIEDIYEADEVFVTNSLMGIMKVSKINKSEFIENKVTRYVREKYEEFLLSL